MLMIDSILKKVESYDEKFSAKIDKEAKEMLIPAIDSINNFNSIEDINYCLHNFVETKNIKIGKLIEKENIHPVFLRMDSELADKSNKKK